MVSESCDEVLDATGLMCPQPMLEARRRLASMAPGALLEIRVDDPLAELDLQVFCERTGHGFVEARSGPRYRVIVVRRCRAAEG
jgi:tRNA 2-thiouridine synthesizing protein A